MGLKPLLTIVFKPIVPGRIYGVGSIGGGHPVHTPTKPPAVSALKKFDPYLISAIAIHLF